MSRFRGMLHCSKRGLAFSFLWYTPASSLHGQDHFGGRFPDFSGREAASIAARWFSLLGTLPYARKALVARRSAGRGGRSLRPPEEGPLLPLQGEGPRCDDVEEGHAEPRRRRPRPAFRCSGRSIRAPARRSLPSPCSGSRRVRRSPSPRSLPCPKIRTLSAPSPWAQPFAERARAFDLADDPPGLRLEKPMEARWRVTMQSKRSPSATETTSRLPRSRVGRTFGWAPSARYTAALW